MKKLLRRLPFGARLTLAYVGVVAIPLLGLTLFHQASLQKALTEAELQKISAIADKKSSQINDFVTERLADSNTFSQTHEVREALKELATAFRDTGHVATGKTESQYRSRLQALIAAHQDVGKYHDLLLIDTDGNVVFSLAHESDLGSNLMSGLDRDSGLASAYRNAMWSLNIDLSSFEPYEPSGDQPAAFAVAPVFDQGTLLGAAALQLDLDALTPVTADLSGLGQTGEIVLAQQLGNQVLYNSSLRNIPNAAFEHKVPWTEVAAPMKLALSGAHGRGVTVDYVQHPVAAAWRYLPSLHLGMVAKIDTTEAFAAAYRAERITWTQGGAMLLISTLLSLLFSQKLSKPLSALNEAAIGLARGDLHIQVAETGGPEFRELAQTFNQMARQLEESRADLERKVQARTAQLAEMSQLQHAILDSTDLIIISTNPNGVITSFNKSAQTVLGYTVQETVGRLTPSVFHDPIEVANRAQQLSDELNIPVDPGFETFVIKSRLHMNNVSEWTYRTRSGKRFPVQLSVSAIWNSKGEISGYLGIAHDITERKQAEQVEQRHREQLELQVAARTAELAASEALYRAMADNATDLVWMLDCDFRFIYQSPAVFQMRGYTVDEAMQQSLEETLTGESLECAKTALTDLIASRGNARIEALELLMNCKNRTPVWTESAATLVPGTDAGGDKIVGISRNITDRKLAEHQREEARRETERLAQLKSDFLANMSHEIRTPLNAVIGLAQIGTRENRGRNSAATFQRILDSGKHLLGVVNDVLDFSKIEAGKLVVESRPFQLRAAIDDAVAMVAPHAKTKTLDLKLDCSRDIPKWVKSDPLRLSQILVNLLSNAVKFTEHGEVALTVRREGNESIFVVSDTGIGITEEQLGRLFVPFEQADTSTTRRFGGTGLGLAISRNLTGLMGGSITVTSKVGSGSTFTVRLPQPATRPHIVQESARPKEGLRLRGLRILAAEDIEVNRVILESLLVDEGAHVVFAEHGQQALDRLEQEGVTALDAVLMDVQMPVMDGYDATRRIKEIAPLLPVIGLTAHAMAQERERCHAAGMVDVVTKPVDIDLVVEAILRHVSVNDKHADHPTTHCVPTETAGGGPAIQRTSALIDWPAFQARCNNRPTFVEKIIRTTLETQSDVADKLRHAAETGDFEKLAFLAHSIKGVAGTLEVQALLATAEQLIGAARARQDIAITLSGAVASTLEAVLRELRASLETGGTA